MRSPLCPLCYPFVVGVVRGGRLLLSTCDRYCSAVGGGLSACSPCVVKVCVVRIGGEPALCLLAERLAEVVKCIGVRASRPSLPAAGDASKFALAF